MKAAVCRKFGDPLLIEDVAIASPGPGEVLVKLAACAICHSDIIFMDGGWGGDLPAVYGHEAAGIVESVGEGVDSMTPGDHVVVTLIRSCGHCHYCAQGASVACETTFHLDQQSPLSTPDGDVLKHGLRTGGFAEYVLVHDSQAVAIDRSVALDCASLLACGVLTGFGAVVNTAAVETGSSVVVIGTGGVGLNSVQGARISGATTIIAIDVSTDKLKAAQEFGATHAINAGDADVVGQVRALTGGRGADYVFVTVGSIVAINSAYALMGSTGAVVLVGMPENGVMSEFEPGNIADQSQRILGSKMGSSRVQIDIPYLVTLYQQGRLKLDELITGRYPLEDINEAIASVKRGEALRNVIVF
ncbi:MAG: Zn-dependent alcohol dehydrogenase [Rhodospirillaceae bacterium]|nr:Zn-dependent alcohol dehydrogenase [Rhodospirillaceae bacterium]